MANRTTGIVPTFPDPATQLMGTPPVNGVGGERGSSAFPGNTTHNADGTLKAGATPTSGPARGVSYFKSVYPQSHSTGTSAVTVH